MAAFLAGLVARGATAAGGGSGIASRAVSGAQFVKGLNQASAKGGRSIGDVAGDALGETVDSLYQNVGMTGNATSVSSALSHAWGRSQMGNPNLHAAASPMQQASSAQASAPKAGPSDGAVDPMVKTSEATADVTPPPEGPKFKHTTTKGKSPSQGGLGRGLAEMAQDYSRNI